MRPLTAYIRLHHLRDNYQFLKATHGGRLLAVVKANAYGHGAIRCAHALADIADGFAVACIEEAVELRESGIKLPIVLLEGVFEPAEYYLVDQHRLWPAVQNQWQLESLLQHPWQHTVQAWLKMDSGMHRAGFFPQHYPAAYTALINSQAVSEVVHMTHFASADDLSASQTKHQLTTFDTTTAQLAGAASLANSAAILHHPAAHRQWGRAGIALYGVSPLASANSSLKPVMKLTTRVFGERYLSPGEPIGYGATFITQQSTRVGLIACGYADGYPRLAGEQGRVWIEGEYSRILGRVSMDMMTIQLADHHQGIGSTVELWGDNISINEVAEHAKTISYEVLCHLKRAQRVYEMA